MEKLRDQALDAYLPAPAPGHPELLLSTLQGEQNPARGVWVRRVSTKPEERNVCPRICPRVRRLEKIPGII